MGGSYICNICIIVRRQGRGGAGETRGWHEEDGEPDVELQGHHARMSAQAEGAEPLVGLGVGGERHGQENVVRPSGVGAWVACRQMEQGVGLALIPSSSTLLLRRALWGRRRCLETSLLPCDCHCLFDNPLQAWWYDGRILGGMFSGDISGH